MAAEQLPWHDATVDSARHDASKRRAVWQVEVFRWDIEDGGDAEPGELVFEEVEHVEALHDVADEPSPEPSYWGVLDGFFERVDGLLRCRFLLELKHRRNVLGGAGYGEIIVTCREAWYTPAREHAAGA